MSTLLENISQVSSLNSKVTINGNESSDELLKYILNFSLDNEVRIQALENYYSIVKEDTIELISRVTGMYQFSGTKIIQNFLYYICLHDINISVFLKLECSKSLLSFFEFEEEIEKDDDKDMIEIKTESNKLITQRNSDRELMGYKALNCVCKKLSIEKDFPSPCKIEAICMLMGNDTYINESDLYFKEFINDDQIDCDYRYKSILSLEKKSQIKNSKFHIKNSCLEFLNNKKNKTMYRILSGQYLLQNLKNDEHKLSEETIENIYNILYSFSTDTELDYNLRADAADTLLTLGTEDYKIKAREIIMLLGQIEGVVRNMYDNAQNVHTKEIEKSVGEILEYLLLYPTLLIEENPIDYNYVSNKIDNILKDELPNKEVPEDVESTEKCLNCKIKLENRSNKYCSEQCMLMFDKHKKIRVSLNRIEMDRTLYSKYSSNLSNILVKLWSYVNNNDFKEAMIQRLIEELEDMSGTCSTGFLSRLINTLSGFGELSIRISFDDQIISNFTGRLNMYARKLTDSDSIFRNDNLKDVIELYIYSNKIHMNYPKVRSMKELINEYLKEDKDNKINIILEDFEEQVLNEMMLETNKFNDRRHFLMFFRAYMLRIREELYEEFKDHVTDTEFDLCIRKAISSYEGVNFLL